MKASTENKVEGTYHEVKGKVKEKAGEITKKPELMEEGRDEQVAGKIRKKIGDIQKVFDQ